MKILCNCTLLKAPKNIYQIIHDRVMNISFPLFQVRKDDLHLWGYEKESTTWLFFKQKERENFRNLHFKRWEKKGAGENNSVFTSELLLLFLTKKVRDSINSHSPDPKKTQKLKKFFFQQLPEKSDWLSATIDGGPPWDFPPPPSLEKKPDEFDHFPNSSPRKKGERARAGQRFFFFTFRPLAWVCVRVFGRWKIKGPLLCEERRENSISLPLVFFFHGQKNEPKISPPDPRGGGRRENYTLRFPFLNARKCSEGKIRLLYAGKPTAAADKRWGKMIAKILSLLGGYALPPSPFFNAGKRTMMMFWFSTLSLSLTLPRKVGEVR